MLLDDASRMISELLCTFIPASEAAVVLNVDPQALRKRAHRDSVPAICVFGVWLFDRHAVEELAVQKLCRLQKREAETRCDEEIREKLDAWRRGLRSCGCEET